MPDFAVPANASVVLGMASDKTRTPARAELAFSAHIFWEAFGKPSKMTR
jgi:hypothetical protein